MKKLCSALVLLLALGCLLCFATGEEVKNPIRSGDFLYVVEESGTATIVGYNGSATTLAIPDSLDGYTVASIGDKAFGLCSKLQSVVIPDSIISIGDGAFRWCSKIDSIAIPDSVAYLGVNPFEYTPAKLSISPEHSAFALIDGALFDKAEKKLIAYPYASSNRSYEIPYGIRTIGDRAFSWCDKIETIVIPDSVTSIGNEAFLYCSKLKSIDIPDSVTYLGDYSFFECRRISSLKIPNGIEHIGRNPFKNCTAEIEFPAEHPVFEVIDGILFDKVEKRLIACMPGNKVASYDVPEGTRSIGGGAFYENSTLQSVSKPDGVTYIGDHAFYSCGIQSIELPDGVTYIGENAFHLSRISNPVAIPNSVSFIGRNAFDGTPITSVSIPNGITTIGIAVFARCSRLESVTIPDSVKTIDDYAFFNCYGLKSVTIPEGVEHIGVDAFDRCPNLSITVAKKSYAAQYCKDNNLTYVLPDAYDWLLN